MSWSLHTITHECHCFGIAALYLVHNASQVTTNAMLMHPKRQLLTDFNQVAECCGPRYPPRPSLPDRLRLSADFSAMPSSL